MRVLITLDRYDGAQGRTIETELEDIRMSDLAFYMTESGVCGFTVSKLNSPSALLRKLGEVAEKPE